MKTAEDSLNPSSDTAPLPAPYAEADRRLPPPGCREQTDSSPPTGAAPPPTDLTDHTRYELLGLLGAGGMGTVYKARHRLMGRLVALKVINPKLLDHPEMVVRFRREVTAAARLSHPNVVAAYDADQAGATHFLVMEYVEGTDLDRVLVERGALGMAEACDCARQAALGLQHAHEYGLVHRDIKPHNLMRTPQGVVKILDFGLARCASETLLPEPASPCGLGAEVPSVGAGQNTAGMTPASAVLGTADYLAPEEAVDARRADIRADIYSLGCALYRFLTGRVPFPGGSLRSKIRRHRGEDPEPASHLRPEVPAALERVLQRMLAKDPAGRYQQPAEVARDLEPFVRPGTGHVLVVEDDPLARQSMARLLEREGYAVETAADGRQALQRLRAGPPPALVLLDLMMPVMDGWEFLREQRQDPALADIPVVVVSAADPRQARAAALGAVDFLRKPVLPEDLAEKVQRHAGRFAADD